MEIEIIILSSNEKFFHLFVKKNHEATGSYDFSFFRIWIVAVNFIVKIAPITPRRRSLGQIKILNRKKRSSCRIHIHILRKLNAFKKQSRWIAFENTNISSKFSHFKCLFIDLSICSHHLLIFLILSVICYICIHYRVFIYSISLLPVLDLSYI